MNRFAHFRTPAAATSLAIVAALLALVLVTSARSPAADPKPESKTVVKVEEARFASVDKAITDNVGKVVLVDVWATWCGPCVKKWPAVAALNKTYRDKGLVLVTASLDKGHRGYKINKVLDFLSDRGATGPNFVMSDPAADRADAKQR
jgi:thiol-disulfide isomerase/thioredoxin